MLLQAKKLIFAHLVMLRLIRCPTFLALCLDRQRGQLRTASLQPARRWELANLGAHPNNHFLKQLSNHQRVDMFNNMFNLYLTGRFCKQDGVSRELWMEDPRPLAELLTKDGQWYDNHFRRVSKLLSALLRHSDDPQIRLLRKTGFRATLS